MSASSFVLCKSKTDILGLFSKGFAKSDTILITEKAAIYLYDVDDKICNHVWTISSTAKAELTNTTVRDPANSVIFAVESHKHILHFKRDYTGDLDQAPRITVNKPIHELLVEHRLNGHLIIVYEDSSFSVLNTETITESKPNTELSHAKSIFSSKIVVARQKVLFYLVQCINNKYTVHFFIKTDEKKEVVFSLAYSMNLTHKSKLTSCDFDSSSNELSLFWEDGTLQVFEVFPSLKKFNVKMTRSIGGNYDLTKSKQKTMESLLYRETLTLLVGKTSQSQYLLSIWNNNYGTVEQTHTITPPESQSSIVSIIKCFSDNGVAIAFNSGVVICSLYSHRGTLASALGSLEVTSPLLNEPPQSKFTEIYTLDKLLGHGENQVASDVMYSSVEDAEWEKVVSETNKNKNKANKLLDKSIPLETHWSEFTQLKKNTVNEEVLLKILERCVEDKYWEGVQYFLKDNMVSMQFSAYLLSALKENAHFELLILFVRTVQDISGIDLVQLIKFALSHSEAHIQDATRALELIKTVFSYPITEIYMIRASKSLLVRECAILLRILIQLMLLSTEDSAPSLDQLVSWSNVLIDSHFIELVLTKDYHNLLFDLQKVIQQQMNLSEKMADLTGPLSLLASKVTLPKKSVEENQYTIKALVL